MIRVRFTPHSRGGLIPAAVQPKLTTAGYLLMLVPREGDDQVHIYFEPASGKALPLADIITEWERGVLYDQYGMIVQELAGEEAARYEQYRQRSRPKKKPVAA